MFICASRIEELEQELADEKSNIVKVIHKTYIDRRKEKR
jgi:hypothetical protein